MSSLRRHETNDNPWSRYQPDETSPWNLRRVVHLHRRAGFGTSWGQIERDLGERLTFMWHNHFATGNLKVEDVALMHRQNASFRRLARAPFGELLGTALR